MARWSRRDSSANKKYRVKIKSMRLVQGFETPAAGDNNYNNHTTTAAADVDDINASTTTNQNQLVSDDQSDWLIELSWDGPMSSKDKKKQKQKKHSRGGSFGGGGGGFNLLPFPLWSKPQPKARNLSTAAGKKIVRTRVVEDQAQEEKEAIVVEWDDEFESICSFTAVNNPRDPILFDHCPITFRVLLLLLPSGQSGASEELGTSSSTKAATDKKMMSTTTTREEVGEATVDLTAVLSKLEKNQNEIEHMVPLQLIQLGSNDADDDHHDDDDAIGHRQPTIIAPATTILSMIISFTDETDTTTATTTTSSSSHSRSTSVDSLEIDDQQQQQLHSSSSIMRRANSLTGKRKKNKNKNKKTTTSSSNFKPATSGEQGKSAAASSETESIGSDEKKSGGGFNWIWRRKGSDSFKRAKTTTTAEDPQPSGQQQNQPEIVRNTPGVWLEKQLTSRDGRSKLESTLFFASFDQRDPRAGGESACAAIVAVFSHHLQSNHPSALPTGPEFDSLIVEGSSEWRKLCGRDEENFPDNHFDLETVIRAELRPVMIVQDRSHIGFFSPERFDFLRGARSFDDIWDEISGGDGGVYIVSWNDHFFVLKVDGEVSYVMDSLGERLYEGCDQAYILKFDESSVMYEKEAVEAEKEGEGEVTKENDEGIETDEEEEMVVVCKGKECCREYMKRFLAALTVRDLVEREEKGNPASIFTLHQRLQIEFHYSLPSAPSSAAGSVSGSPDDRQIPIY